MNALNLIKKESFSQLSFLKEKIEKQELSRLTFSKKEYEEIINYCIALGYYSLENVNGQIVATDGKVKIASPCINNQMKTIKIFNTETHKWGFLQKLKDGVFYGYFQKDNNGNAKFVPKYNFTANLLMYHLFVNMKRIDTKRLKLAAGIVELELA